MRFFGAIDPGKNGALAIVDQDGQYVEAHVMPKYADKVDPGSLFRLVEKMAKGRDILFFLERAHAMPKQGRVSILNYGVYAGFCEMALAALAIPYEMIMPKRWQADMHGGIDTKIQDPKLRSAIKVQRLMGLDKFMIGKRSKPHDGLVDAFLIALHAQRTASRASCEPLKKWVKKKKKSKEPEDNVGTA